MTEKPRALDSKTAYQIAHEQLRQPNCMPEELMQKFPTRFFRYDEDGYGVLLSRGYAYVASGYADRIDKVEGRAKTHTDQFGNQWLEDKFKYAGLGEQIPEEDINAVIRYAKKVAVSCQEIRKKDQVSK